MPRDTFKYTNKDITVVWKPNTCIHSTICWKGLIDVFNPKEKPWIKMEGAGTERIIEQVRKCPSGALSYFVSDNNTATATEERPENKVIAEAAGIVKVEVTPNGPYLIKTNCLIAYGDGREEMKTGTVALCRCGSSANKPYCDGSHKRLGFEG